VLHELINAHISFFGADFYPEAGIAGADGRPYACAVKKVVAENLTAICRVILEPLEIQAGGAKELLILYIFAEMEAEVDVVEVSGLSRVTAGSIAFEAQASINDFLRPGSFLVLNVYRDVILSVAVFVECVKKGFPVLVRNCNMDLRDFTAFRKDGDETWSVLPAGGWV
jgi:hypothetical protein